MRHLIVLASLLLFCSTGFSEDKTFHSFTVKDIDGKDKSLSDFKGKVVLVLNVASK